MFTKKFWMDAAERAVSTAAQAVLTLATLDGTDVIKTNLDWSVLAWGALIAAGFSVLKALAATTFGSSTSASLIK